MNLSELNAGQLALIVSSYEESEDIFHVEIHDNSPCEGSRTTIPAILMPILAKEYGEPHEFLNRTFILDLPAFPAEEPDSHAWSSSSC